MNASADRDIGGTITFFFAVALALGGASPWRADAATDPVPSQSGSSDSVRISSIDFYGVRTLDVDALRKSLAIHEGDLLSRAEVGAFEQKPETRLPPVPQIAHVRVSYTCCDERGGVALFIGVREVDAAQLQFRAAPTGDVRLPPDLVRAAADVEQALMNAVQHGRAEEDDSQGHALLSNDPEGRAAQERLIPYAKRDLRILKQVLHESADERQRAIAASVLGYVEDKQGVVDDLVSAMTDPYENVRNNAMRALLVFTHAKHPPHVPYEPFFALLESPVWTDLNKASYALMSLAAKRDPALLAQLRARALTSLAEIARWHSRGHALAGYYALGYVAGFTEEELMKRWSENDSEVVIRAALGSHQASHSR